MSGHGRLAVGAVLGAVVAALFCVGVLTQPDAALPAPEGGAPLAVAQGTSAPAPEPALAPPAPTVTSRIAAVRAPRTTTTTVAPPPPPTAAATTPDPAPTARQRRNRRPPPTTEDQQCWWMSC